MILNDRTISCINIELQTLYYHQNVISQRKSAHYLEYFQPKSRHHS